jgi:5'-deoxynucleotidase YfbR-like HD superfamily hydrolase
MKLKPNETANALLFALRLTEVSRWGVVATSRQQSVGEHSYRVCMIALAMFDYMEDGTPHNSFDRISIASLAMTHDIFETLSGDLNSIFKLATEAQFPDVYNEVIKDMALERKDTGPLYTKVSADERAAKGTMVEAIVKLSDMVEALIYLDTYGTNCHHRQHVRDNILERMWQKLEEYKRGSSYNATPAKWSRIEQFLNLVLNKPGMDVKVRQDLRQTDQAICGDVAPSKGLCGLRPGHEGDHNHYVY